MAITIGKRAEASVAVYLAKKGLKLLAQNVTYRFGELDLVMQDGDTVVFVEVKYRKNSDFGSPFEAVTKAKQRKIINAARAFLKKYRDEPVCRFDVVAVSGDLANPIYEHINDAFFVEEE